MRVCTKGAVRIVAVAAWLVSAGVPPAAAGFPGANGLIAFETERSGNLDIWVVAPDGSGLQNLTDSPEDEFDPSWSADGLRIAFRRGDDDEREIWIMNADGSNQRRLTVNEAEDEEPGFSPDGLRLVFESDRDGAKDIFVMLANGDDPTNLTNDPTMEQHEPAWSPDGSRIAYWQEVDDEGDTREIWVMNADGTGRTQLTFNDAEDEDPAWSPDGTRLVFESDRDGGKEIYVMGADGSDQTRLTFLGGDAQSSPEWSPDGTRIVFRSSDGGNDDLWVMNADGSDLTRLTDHPDDDGRPSWQPIPVTTTTVMGTTTTTTLPGMGGLGVAGRKLLLKDKADKPQKRALKLVAKDAGIGAGAENGGPGDPTLHGGFLKVISRSGDRFNTTYDLPAANWRTKGKPGKNKGYKLKKAGPITKVLVKLGKSVKLVAKGDALGHTLGTDPNPVHVALGLGSQVYCLTFGGQAKFKPGKTYVAKQAPAPGECTAFVPQCGDGLLEEGESCPELEGPADGPAVDAVSNYDGEPGVAPGDIEEDVGVVRTRVELEFAPDATVAQVNAALDRLGGDIVMMLARVPLLEVRIPDPGSLAALDALIAAANSDPMVRIGRGYLMDDDALPPNFPSPATSDLTKIDNHLAVGAAPAWNGRGAIDTLPLVVVGDSFGDGVPNAATAVLPLDPSDFGSGNATDHGYHVLGILAARFGGTPACGIGAVGSAARGCATGMLPLADGLRVPLRVADWGDTLTALGFRMALVLRAIGIGNVVLNTSQNECFSGMCGNAAAAGDRARQWALMVRGAGLEGRMLHLTSAGNIKAATPAVTDAPTNSSFSAAALLPAIPDFSGTGTMANLGNTLVVENVVNGAAPDFTPTCLAASSKRGSPHPLVLSGIGRTVWSLTDAGSTAGDLSGTSMATPQVAGLAAYLWSIDPGMSVTQLRDLLRATTRPVAVSSAAAPCDTASTQPAAIIDAYAAVLAVDEAAAPTPARAPVRLGLLDLDDDGDFDGDDLLEWNVELIDGVTDEVQEPTSPAYGRHDLNGDGWTGGAARRRAFDLDRVGSTQYGASQLGEVTQDVEGLEVPFDEAAVNDLDALCWYAYSDLYTGTAEARRMHLGVRRCARVEMAVAFPATILPGVAETLTVTVGRATLTGSEPLENVYVELSAAGGSAVPASGTTDAQGELQSQIMLDMDSDDVEVIVQALTAPGGEVLAEEVVHAVAPGLFFDFSDGYQGWTGDTTQAGGWGTVVHLDCNDNDGCIKLDGVDDGGDGDSEPNAWVYQTLALPPGSTTLSFDVSAHDRAGGNAFYRVRLEDQGGASHTLVDWTLKSGVEGSLTFSNVTTSVAPFGGQTVTLYLEQDGNAPGSHEQIYYDNVRVRVTGVPPTSTTSTSSSTSTSTSATTTSLASTSSSSSSTSSSTTTSTSTPTTTTSTTLFAVPVVPYRRYDASGPDGPVVMLGDEFSTEMVDLGAVIHELPPVTIDGLPSPDPTTHQSCYAHPGGVLDDCIDVQDRFGIAPLRLGNPVGVCVPELFPSIAVDAFKCYQATGTPLDLAVTLEDEFQSQAVTIGAPELLCTPAEVDGDPLQDAGRYLVCYATVPAGAAGGQIMVENALHAGPIQVDVGVAMGVCVPAVRQLVTSCDLCGNGVTDTPAGEECDDGNVLDGDGCSAVCRTEGS